MTAETLSGYGMECIGTVQIIDGKFTITVTSQPALRFERCIYAFLVGDEILRVGRSKGQLRGRLSEWQRHVSAAFANRSYRTPATEAAIWKSSLDLHGKGYLYARPGTTVMTPVGAFNLYATEESALIARHRPRCCNDVEAHIRSQARQ